MLLELLERTSAKFQQGPHLEAFIVIFSQRIKTKTCPRSPNFEL